MRPCNASRRILVVPSPGALWTSYLLGLPVFTFTGATGTCSVQSNSWVIHEAQRSRRFVRWRDEPAHDDVTSLHPLGLLFLASSAPRQRRQPARFRASRQPQRVAAPTTSGDRLDTEAAARGVEGLDAAPRTELMQRVVALKKQTEMLQKADKFARAEFSWRPEAAVSPPAVVPEAANASVVVALEELSLEQLRSLVRVLVDENKLWQRVEHASRTALQALDTPASNASAAMVFAAPPAAWRCARLEPSAAALRGAFEEPRHDGRAQPPSMSVKCVLRSGPPHAATLG